MQGRATRSRRPPLLQAGPHIDAARTQCVVGGEPESLLLLGCDALRLIHPLHMPVGHDVMPPFVVPNGQGVTAKSGPGLTRVVVFGHHGLHQKHGLRRSLERARFLLVAQAAVHRITVVARPLATGGSSQGGHGDFLV